MSSERAAAPSGQIPFESDLARQEPPNITEAQVEHERAAEQLRRFVEGSTALVAARTFQALADATAALAVSLFSAAEVFVSLQHRGREVVARHGDAGPTSSLVTWLLERQSGLPPSGNRISAHRLAITLTSRNGKFRGAIAAQLASPPQPTDSHLLDQLSILVTVCSDNLLLYEESTKAARARDDVLTAVSHDLRAPLHNARLGASILRDAIPPEQWDIVERIERSIIQMTRVVNDVVDMVRIEHGKVDLTPQEEGVADLLAAACSLISPVAQERRLRLCLEPPIVPLIVHADRRRVLQVLMNLLNNAVKFTPEGGQVTLRASEESGFVRFEVKDTGAGIPAVEGEQVFERFWRTDPRKRRALGLGLYIAKGLVSAQGGRLWFDSVPGQGSTFFFTLPSAPAESSEH